MPEPTHIGELIPDPENARKHTPRNIGLIERSLNEVGAARSIVTDEDNVIIAGNGVVEAAALAGITKVLTVETDGETIVNVKRRGLTPEQKKRLALYDNRAAELAEWDADALQKLSDDGALSDLFYPDELLALGIDVAEETPLPPTDIVGGTGESLRLIITFADEDERAEFHALIGLPPSDDQYSFRWSEAKKLIAENAE